MIPVSRSVTSTSDPESSDPPGSGESRAPVAGWLFRSPDRLPTLFGLSGEERLRRTLTQAGVTEISVQEARGAFSAPRVAAFRCDRVFDARLVRALIGADDTILVDSAGVPVAAQVRCSAWEPTRNLLAGETDLSRADLALRVVAPDDLVAAYDHQLRRRSPALLGSLRDEDARALEKRLFDASYKGITDFVTKFVWPVPALWAVRGCAGARISPNAVTAASWALTILALWLFSAGRFEAGLIAAWAMTFLDTVDGKLARVTLRSSRIGHVLDHGLDLLHPPFWYAAWAWALPPAPWLAAAVWVTLVGYWVHRGVEGLFLLLFKIEIHSWRRLDAGFRLITTRRNPNLVLLTVGTLAGSPSAGFAAVALWTAASIAFHLARIGKAGLMMWRGRPVRSWYEEAEAPGGVDRRAAAGSI